MNTTMIVGLGNVGREYADTRHNVGFALVELLAITLGFTASDFKPHKHAPADVLDLRASHKLLLVRPTTMMNLSGEAVRSLANYFKFETQDIWVAYDEVDLPFGALRISHDGASAGHNGIKSIIAGVGSDFWRIRMGVRNEQFGIIPTDKFVLSRFTPEEVAVLPGMFSRASDILESAVTTGQITTGDVDLLAP